MKGKSIHIVLLILVMFSFAYYPFLLVQKFVHKKKVWSEMKHSFPKDKLAKFEFSCSDYDDLNWIESHEFELDGNLYDVVTTEKKGDLVVLFCIKDTQEKEIKERIEKQIEKDLGHNENAKKFKKAFDLQCEKLNNGIRIFDLKDSALTCRILKPYTNLYQTIYYWGQFPPPKIA